MYLGIANIQRMNAFLISYDLSDKSKSDELIDHLEDLGATMVTESCYFVNAELQATDIRNGILLITKRISLAVFKLGQGANVAHHQLVNREIIPWK